MDGGEKVALGLIVAGGDGSKLLEPAEEVLDVMTLLVELLTVFARIEATFSGRNDGFLARSFKRLTNTDIHVEGFVCNQDAGFEPGKQGIGAVQIMRLTGRKIEACRFAQCIGGGVDLGTQSAP